jgi:hypothetical protein
MKRAGDRLALTEVAGNLTYTARTVTTWFTLPERVWAFRAHADLDAWLTSIATQYAGLAGCRLHLRRTTRPYPVGQWAANLLRTSPPDPALAAHLQRAARHLDAATPVEGLTMLGITFNRAGMLDGIGAHVAKLLHRSVTDGNPDAERAAKYADLLRPVGLGAEPSTETAIAWLLYRSIGLGLTPPDRRATSLGPEDILAATDHIDRIRTRYGATVRFVNRHTEDEAHVAVLTVGRMEPQEIPEVHEPWLHLADRADWPVELSSRVNVLGPQAVSGPLLRRLLMIRSQQKDYGEHGLDAPPDLERLADRALTVGDEIGTGRPVDAARVHGWHRLAVSAPTAKGCLARCDELIRLYDERARITLRHPKDQDRLAREFIPGEPVADTGYLRRMPVRMFAAAVPQAAAAVGDGRGDLIGWTVEGKRPVMFDAQFPMEVRERSGLAVFVSEPGGGKSTLIGALGYLAARRGVQVTLLDPSGPLARLAQTPAMRGQAKVINLAGTERGTLAPYALVPTPRPADFGDARSLEMAAANARAERRSLVLDVCQMLLPPQVARRDDAVLALRDATRRLPAEESTTLDDVIQALTDTGDVPSKNVANLLLDAADLPLAQLFFGRPPVGSLDVDAPLTIITLGGLQLPDLSTDRDYWSVEESLAVPMLHTAHRLAVRRCYGGDMTRRKLVGLDEAHFMQGWSSGRSFLVRLARDSRKYNLAALVASQNPRDILGLDVQNLVSTVFVGRIADDAEIAAEALRLLRIPAGFGHEAKLAGLSAHDGAGLDRLGFRDFVMRDVDGRVQQIRVDVSWPEHLLEYLDTTPGGTR